MMTNKEKERLIKDLEGLRIDVDSKTQYNYSTRILKLMHTRANEMLNQCIKCVNDFYDAEKAKQIKSTDDFMIKAFVDNMEMNEFNDLMSSNQYPEDYEVISSPIRDSMVACTNDEISEIYGCSDTPIESSFLG